MKIISNSFSLQMLNGDSVISVKEITEDEFDKITSDPTIVSAVGHSDTALLLGVKFNRINVSLNKGDVLYVAQLTGGRLPEGATKLPDMFRFRYFEVKVL